MSDNSTTNRKQGGDSAEAPEVELWAIIATERQRLADELDGLTADQWQSASHCEAWSVRDVLAHLVTPFRMSSMKFVFNLIKNRANFDKTMIDLAAGTAAKLNTAELIHLLRENADNRWAPPGRGAEIPLSEVVVHGQDIRRALGLPMTVPTSVAELSLRLIEDPEIRADYRLRIGH